MGTYDSAITLAKRLIAAKGEAITLRTVTLGATDADKPWKPAENSTDDQDGVRAVFLNYGDQSRLPKTYADGSEVRIGDKRVLISGVGLTAQPDINSLLIRGDGSVWACRACEPLDPDGTVIFYEMWVRQ